MTTYIPHGRADFQKVNSILEVNLYGPWNLECILEAAEKARPFMESMSMSVPDPWAIVVHARDSLLCTQEALHAMRDKIRLNADLAPTAVAWVAHPDIEARELMVPVIKDIYDGIVPMHFFETLSAARLWVQKRMFAVTYHQSISVNS